jgi:hypothetical protein
MYNDHSHMKNLTRLLILSIPDPRSNNSINRGRGKDSFSFLFLEPQIP